MTPCVYTFAYANFIRNVSAYMNSKTTRLCQYKCVCVCVVSFNVYLCICIQYEYTWTRLGGGTSRAQTPESCRQVLRCPSCSCHRSSLNYDWVFLRVLQYLKPWNIIMCIHLFSFIHPYIHPYIHACMHTYIHAYIHSYIHTRIHAYIHSYIHTCRIQMYMHACIHTYTHCKHCIHTCIHNYIHTSVHLCIYMYAFCLNVHVRYTF